jgi:DNA-binding response OmpR family regulator
MTKRILVVEDDEFTRDTMRETLLADGFEVDTAAAGQAALEKIRQHRYDAAVVDLMLPDSDGVLLRQRIEKDDPLLSTRVIFTTGFTDQPTVLEYLRRAGSAFVPKPFRPGDLLDAVHRSLRGDED